MKNKSASEEKTSEEEKNKNAYEEKTPVGAKNKSASEEKMPVGGKNKSASEEKNPEESHKEGALMKKTRLITLSLSLAWVMLFLADLPVQAQDARGEFLRQLGESRGLMAVGESLAAAKNPDPAKAAATKADASLAIQYAIELERGNEPVRLAPPESVFQSGDKIRLKVTPARTCHVYVIYHGQDGSQSELLFPNEWNGDSKIAGGVSATIPGKGAFLFDQEKGQERVSILFSPKPIEALEGNSPKNKSLNPTPQEALQASAAWPGGRGRGLLIETHQESGGAINYAVDKDAKSATEPAVLKLVLNHQ